MADKTVKINVDSSEAGRFQSEFRRDAEQIARDMIRSSRQYSTSSKEVLRDIEDQIRAIEKRNKLDAEFKRVRLESLRERGGLSDAQYGQQRGQIFRETRQDELQTRLIRELIDTVVRTSKDEIREDRRNVEKVVQESKTVGRLGVEGDELKALKETVQYGAISQANTRESAQKAGFNMSRYANSAMMVGGALTGGDVGGLAMMGSRGLMGMMSGVGVGGGLALAGGASILGLIAGAFASNKDLAEKTRPYMIASQRGVSSVFGDINDYTGYGFNQMGMSPFQGMEFNAGLRRASGGRLFNQNQMLGYAGITRSRDVSPELLNSLIANQRYSTSGEAMSVATTLERTLEKIYPKEFKDKLVQLPEMMSVYNSLAQQMIQTTGSINSNQLSGFVGGIREGFGVEGVNLQRYTTGMLNGFRGSQNSYLRKMQFAALRQTNPNISYQEALETLQNPTSNVDYMRNYASLMKRQGLTQFRSWFDTMGLGAEEARKAFESGDFEKAFSTMGKINKDKTSPEVDFEKFYKGAQDFYSAAEKQSEALSNFGREIKSWLGEHWESYTASGVARGFKQYETTGGTMPVKDVNKFR